MHLTRLLFIPLIGVALGCPRSNTTQPEPRATGTTDKNDQTTSTAASSEESSVGTSKELTLPVAVDPTLSLEKVAANVADHKGKTVRWQGRLISMKRDVDKGMYRMVFLAGDPGPAPNVQDMELFAAESAVSDEFQHQLMRLGDESVWIVGIINGTESISTDTVTGSTILQREAPLISSAILDIEE
jgi:hypothetical protein